MVSTLKVTKIQIPNSDSDVISLDATTGNIAFNKTKIENLGLIAGDILMPFESVNQGSGYGVQQILRYKSMFWFQKTLR